MQYCQNLSSKVPEENPKPVEKPVMSEAVKEPVDSAKVKSVTQQQTDENTTTTKTTNENKAEIEKKEVKTPQVQNGQKNEEIVSFQNLHIKHF